MKKMSRKNFRGGPLFSSKSSSSTPTNGGTPSPSDAGGAGIVRRATWADKIRDKLPPLGENEYEVLWERGVLGVIFLESEKDGIPYVSKATESCISPAVSQGDILKYVNVVRSKDHSFSDFFKILATMKKPVLLRFERLAASTPSSDEDEASQLFGVQRASSTNAVNSASHYARQNGAANADEGDPAGTFQRANSAPNKDQKPPKATRGAFWRAPSNKDSMGPANSANGAPNDRLGASQAHRRIPSNRDHQVSPRDAVAANGASGHSSHSPLGPHEYQVYWETGSLGLFFGEDRSSNLPVVTRSTPSANPVVRRAVAINDTLVSANGIRSADYTFESFFGRLQQMNKPVRLVFRRRQPTDQVVIIKQGDHQQQQQQQRQQQQQMQQQLQQRQQQMLEQQREQQQREQQQLHERQLREQQQREREKQRERELQQREQHQRERQLLEEQLREKQREKQRRQQEELARNRTPSITVDTTTPSSTPSPPEGTAVHRSRMPSPTVKRASTPPPRPPSPQVRIDSEAQHREHRHAHAERGRTPPPSSPVLMDKRQQETREEVPSTNFNVSPRADASRSSTTLDLSPQFDMSPGSSPTMGDSPKVSSSPLASPISPFVSTEVSSETINLSISSNEEDDTLDVDSPVEAEVEESHHTVEKNAQGRRSRNSSEDQRKQHTPVLVREEEPALSPVSKQTHVSPTEPWDLPEQIPSPTLKAEPIAVEEETDEAVYVSPSAEAHLEPVEVAEDVEISEEAESLSEDREVVADAELVEEAELAEEVALAEAAELAEEAALEEAAEPAVSVESEAEDSTDLDVEVGMLAEVAMGIAVEETEAEDSEQSSDNEQNESPWDLEADSDRHKTRHHGTSSGSSAALAESSKVDFSDASESSDEFSSDPDISSDIDIVDGDIMMQEAPKDKSDATNPPKPSKTSLNANLAKYKKKGKTSRGVMKLPALTEEEALTVPLVAPNAVNTTVQVRGRPKPKLTMADTPDSTTYLIKWKENRSIGIQLKEVRFAKGTYPLVTDVCQEPCCGLLRHICVGDVIIEINGRNTSTMGVKKTVNFLKTCTKTTLMKIRHGPAFVNQRVSAAV